MSTKESIKQDVSHFLPISHPSHLGSGKEENDTTYFVSEESATALSVVIITSSISSLNICLRLKKFR